MIRISGDRFNSGASKNVLQEAREVLHSILEKNIRALVEEATLNEYYLDKLPGFLELVPIKAIREIYSSWGLLTINFDYEALTKDMYVLASHAFECDHVEKVEAITYGTTVTTGWKISQFDSKNYDKYNQGVRVRIISDIPVNALPPGCKIVRRHETRVVEDDFYSVEGSCEKGLE